MGKCVECGVEMGSWFYSGTKRCNACKAKIRAERDKTAVIERGICGYLKANGDTCKRPKAVGSETCSGHSPAMLLKAAETVAKAEAELRARKQRQEQQAAEQVPSARKELDGLTWKIDRAKAELSRVERAVADAAAAAIDTDTLLLRARDLAQVDPVGNAAAITALTELSKEARLARWAARQDAKETARKKRNASRCYDHDL